jgi:two-component system chemotaxis response regulator CheB
MVAPLVVIGCSWGGLGALQAILDDLPADFPSPVIVVQHRGVEARDSGLAESLARHCALPVRTAEDKDQIEPGTVFVAPPGYHLLVEPGTLALSTDERVHYSRPSIDVLFDSAADAYGDDVIGVILTGANADGAAGLRTIRERGGLGLVQDPAEAERDAMPLAAISAGAADQVLPLAAIGAELVRRCGDVPTNRSEGRP